MMRMIVTMVMLLMMTDGDGDGSVVVDDDDADDDIAVAVVNGHCGDDHDHPGDEYYVESRISMQKLGLSRGG